MASESSQDETRETSPTTTIDVVDLKGKSPVNIKDEDIVPSSSGGDPPIAPMHDLASLLTMQEQGMVTSPRLSEEMTSPAGMTPQLMSPIKKGAMEKETKEWINQEQLATLNTLRIVFPHVKEIFLL